MKSKVKLLICMILLSAIALNGSGVHESEKEFDINDYAWLAGSWVGDGFGGTSEETWSQPSPDGTMMGMYRHLNAEGEVTFYEFLLLDQNGIRLKHFTPELVGWESKEDFLTFEMIEFTPDKIELEGLVFERKSDDEMEIRLRLKRGDKIETEVFNMKRRS